MKRGHCGSLVRLEWSARYLEDVLSPLIWTKYLDEHVQDVTGMDTVILLPHWGRLLHESDWVSVRLNWGDTPTVMTREQFAALVEQLSDDPMSVPLTSIGFQREVPLSLSITPTSVPIPRRADDDWWVPERMEVATLHVDSIDLPIVEITLKDALSMTHGQALLAACVHPHVGQQLHEAVYEAERRFVVSCGALWTPGALLDEVDREEVRTRLQFGDLENPVLSSHILSMLTAHLETRAFMNISPHFDTHRRLSRDAGYVIQKMFGDARPGPVIRRAHDVAVTMPAYAEAASTVQGFAELVERLGKPAVVEDTDAGVSRRYRRVPVHVEFTGKPMLAGAVVQAMQVGEMVRETVSHRRGSVSA